MQVNAQLLENHQRITHEIDNYNKLYKNNAKLLLVSKNLSQEQIEYIVKNSKQKEFGENKVQDSGKKWCDFKEKYPDIKLHFIGKLQTNKIKKAVELFDVIETIDSFDLASKVNDEALKINKKIKIYLQVNVGDEEHKNGINLKDFDSVFKKINSEVINVSGLMCIPPINSPAFFYFGIMKKIAKEHKIQEISMGMSNDFETAIKFGSTQVRIGSLITNLEPS